MHSKNVIWHQATVTRERREASNNHKGAILWFTGFSGSGKSTLAHAVEESLYQKGCKTFVLDGDNVRHGLCSDLSFSDKDRKENIRRIGEMSRLFAESGTLALTAFISPFQEDRQKVRDLAGDDFIEIHCQCDISTCESRDVKGLYKKARQGEIKDFTGISSPYEAPEKPEVTLDTGAEPLEECVEKILAYLVQRDIISTK